MSLCFERESEFNRAEFVFGRKRELIGFCFGEKEIKKKKNIDDMDNCECFKKCGKTLTM